MKLTAALVAFFAAVDAINSLEFANSEVFESLRGVPQGWHPVGKPNADARMKFRIAVRMPNPDFFHQTLNEIADPSHARYGRHLNRDELKDLVRPDQRSTDAVKGWLRASGVQDADVVEDGEFINFIASISQAETMMDTQFETYQSLNKRSLQKVRALKYSLPRDLHQHVDMIQPTTRFAQVKPEFNEILKTEVIEQDFSVAKVINSTCNSTITLSCLTELYNIKGFTPKGGDESGLIGVSGFLEQYAQYDDLTKWAKTYAPAANNATFSWASINGGLLTQNPNNKGNDSVEANLDIQYTVGLSYPLQNKYYSTAGRGLLVPDLDQPDPNDNSNEPYLEYFTYLLNLDDKQLPHTISTSYGEDEQSVPASYAQKVCDLIGQLGARGVSVLFSSGDTGVGSACQTNDGKNTTRFLPIFPASCPYVTAVGGTTRVGPEYAVGFSSGGFSDRWPRPWWQEAAVTGYLEKLGDRWNGLYNPSGRGFPDIAAQGRNFRVVDKGRDIQVSGTSASAPVVAGIIALLNAARKEAGRPTLGFLNPWLYSKGKDALTDIVNGGSSGCTGIDIYSGLPTPKVEGASWNATVGWDPVTGLGTPLFDRLLEVVRSEETAGGSGGGGYGGVRREVRGGRYDKRVMRERIVRKRSWLGGEAR